MTIDSAASTLIRYTLAEAVAKNPAKDKCWTKLRAAIVTPQRDIQVIVRLIDEVETLVDEKQKLKAEAIKDLEETIAGLKAFQKTARELQAQLSSRAATLAASVTAAE